MTSRPERPLTRADVLSAEQVADLLGDGWNPRRVRDWAAEGKLPSVRRGRVRFYLRWQIEAWLCGEHDDRAA